MFKHVKNTAVQRNAGYTCTVHYKQPLGCLHAQCHQFQLPHGIVITITIRNFGKVIGMVRYNYDYLRTENQVYKIYDLQITSKSVIDYYWLRLPQP